MLLFFHISDIIYSKYGRAFSRKEKVDMKKIFTKRLFIYMLVALLITITGIFGLQTIVTQKNNAVSSQNKLQDVKERLDNNQKNIESLTNNLSEDNLAKTRAFADMLAIDPSIAGNMAKLNQIKDRLKVIS